MGHSGDYTQYLDFVQTNERRLTMLDLFESMEASAELQFDLMQQPDGQLKCSCGKLFDPDEGTCISPNPYAMPVCPTCFEAWCAEQ